MTISVLRVGSMKLLLLLPSSSDASRREQESFESEIQSSVPALSYSCVTLDKLPNLSEPQSSSDKNEDNTYLTGLM